MSRDALRQLARAQATERRLWQQIDKARAAGESAEVLEKLAYDVKESRDTQRSASGQIYHDSCLRDGVMPYAKEYGEHNGWDR